MRELDQYEDTPDRRLPRRSQQATQRCGYCGAVLDPRFYFCTQCATPYKSEESVVPQQKPELLTAGKLIRQKAPGVWPLFWVYVGVVVGSGVLGVLLFRDDRPDLAMIVAHVIMVVTTSIYAAIHWQGLSAQFKRIGFTSGYAWAGLALLAPLLLLNYAYHSFILYLAGGDTQVGFDRLRDTGLSEGSLIFMIAVLPALTEEIAFRGLVQQWLRTAIGPTKALLLASALFMALHMAVISFPYLLLVGLLLGWVKLKTGSLYPPMVIHFLHNLIVLEVFPFG